MVLQISVPKSLNEMKTKILVFGKNQQGSNVKHIYFNGKVIPRSQKYKYLGNLLSDTQTNQGDMFRYTYEHLCNKARNVLFSIEKKLTHLGVLPPTIAIYSNQISNLDVKYGGSVKRVLKRLIHFR